MGVDGTAPKRLTTGPAEDSNPAWSPDGRFILFVSNRSGQYEIYGMNADDSSGQADLTDSAPESDLAPAWQAIPGPPPTNKTGQSIPQPHLPPGLASGSCPSQAKNPIVGRIGNFDDTLKGTSGPDVICGLGGNDTIRGLGGNDTIYPGPGKDTVIAGAGNDQVMTKGDGSRDVVWAGPGSDDVVSDPMFDTVHGAEVDPDR
jgi:hypothetical protein